MKSRGALVTYLALRDASPSVCDLGADGPHLAVAEADARDDLMDGLREHRFAPALAHPIGAETAVLTETAPQTAPHI